jgi:hypothetical protein
MLETFFKIGFHHLTESGAWDHQLFLATIALAYAPVQWRKWIALATAFAIGHTAAIASATLGWVPLGLSWVEPAIAASIVVLAMVDLVLLMRDPLRQDRGGYWFLLVLILAFGFVHGLGFGSAFVPLVAMEEGTGRILSMFASFTLGVEVAQLLILGVFWVVALIVFDLLQWHPLLLRKALLVLIALKGTLIFWGSVGG